MKQQKIRNKVSNILKSAQQDNGDENLPHSGVATEEDVLGLEDEDHLQSHHVTTHAMRPINHEF
jgi:hypothetical protein